MAAKNFLDIFEKYAKIQIQQKKCKAVFQSDIVVVSAFNLHPKKKPF